MGASRPRRRRVVRAAAGPGLVGGLLALLVVLGVLGAAPASAAAAADDPVGAAADAFADGPLYVAPGAAPRLDGDDRAAMRQRLERSSTPVFVAVLPESASARVRAGADGLPFALYQQAQRPGTYGVLVGDRFVAGSTVLGPSADRLARRAAATSADDPVTAVLDFTDGVEAAAVARQESQQQDGATSAGTFPWTQVLLVLGVAGLGYLLVRRRGERAAGELAGVRGVAQEDVAALAGDLADLDPGDDPAALAAAATARREHERAAVALLEARRPSDLAAVSGALAEGRYALASARALAVGLPPPVRRPPCLFDPRHGPSHTDSPWAPPGGSRRPVPVCADCAIRLAQGSRPTARRVPVEGIRRPYWDAGPSYGPWAGGYFRATAGGSLLPHLLAGTPLAASIVVPPPRDGAGAERGDDVDA